MVIAGCAAAALAQAPAPPAGNYGGGRLQPATTRTFARGNMIIELRAAPGGAVQINAAVFLSRSCPYEGFFSARTTVAPDGTFSVAGTTSEPYGRSVRIRYAVSGTLGVASATGTASAGVRIYRGARRAGSCATVSVGWAARRPTAGVGAPGAAPGATLMGTTSQRSRGPHHAIIMSISPNARRIRRSAFGVSERCAHHVEPLYDAARDNIPIAADGTFKDLEHYTSRDRRFRFRGTDRFSGQIRTDGASGTLSTVERTISRRTGRTLRTCASGTVRWTASP